MNRVIDIPKSLLISFYISRLKLHLLVSRPTTLGDAFAFARITDARLEGQTAALTGTTTKPVAAVTPQRQLVPRLGGVSGTTNTTKPPSLPNPTGTSKPLAIKWISSAERQERLNKGLCFNCDNRWTHGYKCPGKFLLLITKEEDDMGAATGDGGDDAVESGDISILNSLIGHGSPRSLPLWEKIGKGDVYVLNYNGSTHNFIRLDVVEKMCLPIKSTKTFKVYIGSGESLLCESVCSSVTVHMQGVEHQFYVKKTKCVFGAETLEYLGHMISGRRVEMDPKKVIAVRDWLKPTTQRQVRGFLGLAGYYRRFIKGYATMAAPLTELLRKDAFRWDDQEATTFWELKQQLSTTPILSLPDFTQEFFVKADASDYGIGAVLL
ncbi:ty3-gypsy retrotransposon protein [Tanacetum coccineum]